MAIFEPNRFRARIDNPNSKVLWGNMEARILKHGPRLRETKRERERDRKENKLMNHLRIDSR